MRLLSYLTESEYEITMNRKESGYIECSYTFRIPNSSKFAGLHLSLSDYNYREPSIEKGKYWNYGYSLIASTKRGNTTTENGKDAKKYYPLESDREYIKEILYKVTKDFIRDNPCPMIIRGPLNDIKIGLERYQHITDIIKSQGYTNVESLKVGGNNYIIQSKGDIGDIESLIPVINKRWK